MKANLIIGLALLTGACDDDNDKALDETSAMTDRLCACPDTVCAEKVEAELHALKDRRAQEAREDPSGKQIARAVKISLRWDECLEQVRRRSR